ncbi:MAG: hypothetical protein O3C57_03080 [Verrucomicrobia bacterium]|nr:hypothetical protein [Verrucomicrobiota bacterium]
MKSPVTRKLFLVMIALAAGVLLLAATWVSLWPTPALSGPFYVIGNLHPLILHLPIGIFVLALFSAFVGPFLSKPEAHVVVLPQMLGLAALTAYVSAAFGLLLFMQGDYSGELIEQHLRWGVAFAVVCLLLYAYSHCLPDRRKMLRVLMLGGAAAMTFAGHYGGVVTHGDPLAPLRSHPPVVVEGEAETIMVYEDLVARILKDKCNRCHAEDTKQKAGLKLDRYDHIMAGSKNGKVLVPGSLVDSPVSVGIHLPLEDDLHMPPDGKPQLDTQEIKLIDAWILAGAKQGQSLMETGWDSELIEWARAYVLAATERESAVVVAPAQVDAPWATLPDFPDVISAIEAVAPKGVTRISTEKPMFIFSALNARSSFGDAQLQLLTPLLPYLTQIDLSGSQITSNAIAGLAGATQLNRLDVSNTRVGDEALAVLAQLPTLKQLNLYASGITPASLKMLSGFSQLESLQVGGAGLSAEELQQLKDALPDCRVVGDHLNDPSLNQPAP